MKDKILPTLREAIINGELAPDAHLSEVELARILEVSRTPVREALAKLQQEGLVTNTPRMGSFVRQITVQDIEEIYQVRDALEVLATSLACQRITEEGKTQLRDLMTEMRNVAPHRDPRQYAKYLDEFHLFLMRASGNRTLENMYRSLIGPIRRIRRITLTREGRINVSLQHHLTIGEAIINNDPEASRHMHEHIQDARAVVTEVARKSLKAEEY